MADTLSRPSASARPPVRHPGQPGRRGGRSPIRTPRTGPRPVALVGIALAAWTVLLGLAVLICVTLAAWVTAPHHDGAIRPAISTAIQSWLLAQHGVLELHERAGLGAGSVSLMPLGLTFLLGALLVRAGRQVARLSGATDLVAASTSALAFALPYAVIAALLTKPAQLGAIRPSPLQALTGAFVLAIVCSMAGALREIGQLESLVARLPDDLRDVARAGLAASAVVVGVGAVGLAAGLVSHAGRAADLAASLHGGYSGVVLMSLISLVYAPNAVLWASAYSLGPGFAVGTHTSVALGGVQVGAVPAVPLLAPLPDTGSAPWISWLLVAGPIAAGVLAGWMYTRRRPVPAIAADAPWWRRQRLAEAAWGFAIGAVAALVLGVLAALSAGPFGGGRMSALGPSALWVMLAALLEIGLLAAVTIWVLGWHALRDQQPDRRQPQEQAPVCEV